MTPLALALVAATATSTALFIGSVEPPSATSPTLGRVTSPEPEATAAGAASWPVQPAGLVRGFEGPEQYGPGHRGVDLPAWPGQIVRAALPGVVRFVGKVAGRSIVVVGHEGGLRTTYLPVSGLRHEGDRVRAGDRIGLVSAEPHCPVGWCLHWGARQGESYIDPLSLLPGQVVLLPID